MAVNVIHRGVGGINESDVMLAAASDGIVLGFNVRPVGDARAAAEREGVEIRTYTVIYRAIEDLRAAMEGMLEPEEVEDDPRARSRCASSSRPRGSARSPAATSPRARSRRAPRSAWCATAPSSTTARSPRLRRFNDDVREVAAGHECGIVLKDFQDVKEGDVLEVYETRKVERELVDEPDGRLRRASSSSTCTSPTSAA